MWQFVLKTDDCWLWQGKLDKDGYGTWFMDGRNWRPHRLALQLSGYELRPDLVTRHFCENRHCVNPAHMTLGTQKENIHDQLRAGTHSKLKYSDEIIQKIREEYKRGEVGQRALSKKYGVSKSQVQMIVLNRTRTVLKETV